MIQLGKLNRVGVDIVTALPDIAGWQALKLQRVHAPTTENGYENCLYSTNNFFMSDDDNNHDTNYINKHKDANHDTRKLHL